MILTKKQVAERCGVSDHTVHKWLFKRKILPYIYVGNQGRSIGVKEEDLKEFLKRRDPEHSITTKEIMDRWGVSGHVIRKARKRNLVQPIAIREDRFNLFNRAEVEAMAKEEGWTTEN